jgi:hypothetical protein
MMNNFSTTLSDDVAKVLLPINHTASVIETQAYKAKTETTYKYDLEIPEDIHWKLVMLGAKLKMHEETYVEQLLKEHVQQVV